MVSVSVPLVARPCAPTHVLHPHVASRPEQANLSSNSSSTAYTSHSKAHISSSLSLVARPNTTSHVLHSHVAPRSERATQSPPPVSAPSASYSTVHIPSQPSSPRKKRSRRCFVCGGTGKHRLSPRFCPRTFELVGKHLAKFNADFRLVSFDGSPLPMTRHPGGVAAHLLAPRRCLPPSNPVSSHRVSSPDRGSHLNPPHVLPIARVVPPRILLQPLRSSDPPATTSIPDQPYSISDTVPRPSLKPSPPCANFIQELFDAIILSSSFRRQFEGLIRSIDRLDTGGDPFQLWERFRAIRNNLKPFSLPP
ncbi:hypothetical protein DFH07DRAFT_863417 [Mycena maculata]|uniref:Uncharacterized protein n=1 Tax=Mycena maculata TaxID=230809 RepID=A0AAD7H7M9_9AGAR|nr:hypothetical protein DFH07DRAFT_863417 [Mycena maculata]